MKTIFLALSDLDALAKISNPGQIVRVGCKREIKFKGTVSCSVRDVYATVAVEVVTLSNQNWVSLKAPESTGK